MSGNMVSTFEAVDALKPLGGLTCLYLEHNPFVQGRSGIALLRFVVDVVGGGGGGVDAVGVASIFVRRVILHPSPFLTYVCKNAAIGLIRFASVMVFNRLNRVCACIRPLCTSGDADITVNYLSRLPPSAMSTLYGSGLSLRICCVIMRPYPPSCLLYTSPSPRDATLSRMPSSA